MNAKRDAPSAKGSFLAVFPLDRYDFRLSCRCHILVIDVSAIFGYAKSIKTRLVNRQSPVLEIEVMSESLSFRRCVLTAIVSLATITMAARSASADSIGYYLFGVNFSSNGGYSLPQFDPSLGSLESVTITAFASVWPGDLYLQNLNPEAGGTVSVTYTAGWRLFAGEDSLNLMSGTGSVSASGIVAPFGTAGPPLGPGPDTFMDSGIYINIASQTNTLYSGFSDFIGTGSVNLYAEADAHPSWTSDPTDLSLVWTNAPAPGSPPGGFASGTLLYTFTSVPEPSTLVLLGIGAVSPLAYGWRRRRPAS